MAEQASAFALAEPRLSAARPTVVFAIPIPELPLRPSLLAAFVVVAPITLAAQQLEPGARIRVRLPCEEGARCYPLIGHVRSVSHDTLVMERIDGGLESIPRTPDTRIDVSHGIRRRIPEGMAIGAAGGAVLSSLAQGNCSDGCLGGYILVPLGAVVGAILGGQHRTEVWLPVREPSHVAVVPLRGGVGVGVRLGL